MHAETIDTMKIVAPISRIEEASVFARNGADELFFGVIPAEWTERYGRFTANRRSANNLGSLADVKRVVEDVQREGKRASVALNGTTHTPEQVDFISNLAIGLADIGIDALIVGDIQLLSVVNQLQLPVRLHVSSTASCRNIHTARFFQKFGADRIILPRHIALKEIGVLVKGVPDMEFEAFVLNDGCPYEEGLCHTLHLPMEMGGPLCFESFETEVKRLDGAAITAAEAERIADNDAHYDHWRWSKFSRGFTTTEAGQPYGPCGLCAIPHLQAIGIEHIKIAGRDGNPLRKKRSLEMVTNILAKLDEGAAPSEITCYARNLRGQPELCRNSAMCYYPDMFATADEV